MLKEKRTRFAPSPSGDLHIGGARTALFNYLLAKKLGGLFVLRVEDTDQNRSSDSSIDNIVEAMKWLGINWDEGPGTPGVWNQSQRLNIYKEYAKILIDTGFAYPCFCPNDKDRDDLPQMYDRKCRQIPKNEASAMMKDLSYCVRMVNPMKPVEIKDMVFGDISINTGTFEDFIIVRGNGYPMYNFACAIDDMLMNITHVIRGSEHIPNTPKQILIYEALNAPIPKFAHLSLILDGTTKKKMSKRDKGASVLACMREGLSPISVRHYIATLGWNPRNIKEYTIEELARKFDLNEVKKTPALHDAMRLSKIDHELKGKLLA